MSSVVKLPTTIVSNGFAQTGHLVAPMVDGDVFYVAGVGYRVTVERNGDEQTITLGAQISNCR